MEGQWFLAGNTLVSLSEGELAQCVTPTKCTQGSPASAAAWVVNNGGIDSLADYPYTGPGACDESKLPNHVATFSGSVFLPPGTEDYLANWIAANGPLSVVLNGNWFHTYTGGVVTSPPCDGPALPEFRAVLIVGYDITNSPPYWIVKNSEGTNWGEAGYFEIAYGHNLVRNREFRFLPNSHSVIALRGVALLRLVLRLS